MLVRATLCLLWALTTLCSAQELVGDGDDAVMISEKGILLVCYLNGTSSEDKVTTGEEGATEAEAITWVRRDETGEEPLDEFVKLNSQGRSTLRMNENDTREGEHFCRWGTQEARFMVTPYFKLEKVDKSLTVTEEEQIVIYCTLKPGSYEEGTPEFKWYMYANETAKGTEVKDEESANDVGPPHYIIKVGKETMASSLTILNATFTDRAYYSCNVTLKRDDNLPELKTSFQTFLRVKDKYAALYPFIGIVLEVIALTLIIFICERRKSSQEEEEEDDDYTTVPGNGNSNLRHRRT